MHSADIERLTGALATLLAFIVAAIVTRWRPEGDHNNTRAEARGVKAA